MTEILKCYQGIKNIIMVRMKNETNVHKMRLRYKECDWGIKI